MKNNSFPYYPKTWRAAKLVLMLVFTTCFLACEKSSSTSNNGIIGRWKLYDSYASPGTGVNMNAIPWIKADSLHPSYIEFNQNGILTISSPTEKNTYHYLFATDSSMSTIVNDENFTQFYSYSDSLLTIYGAFGGTCFEFCGSRYTRDSSVHE